MQLDQWNIQTHGLEGENHYLVAFHGIQAQVRKRQIGPNRLILQFGDNHASFFDDYREDGVVIQLKPPDRCTHAVASAPQVLAIITHNMRRRANPPALKLADFPEFLLQFKRIMQLSSALLPDGRTVHCVNPYEVEFGAHEIFSEDLTRYGLDLTANGVFVDVGANIGLFCVYLIDRCPHAKVFAFEPMPFTFSALENNIREFAPSATALNMGLGAAPATVQFDYYPAITALSTCNSAAGQELAGGIRKLLFHDAPGEAMERILDKTGVAEVREASGFAESLFRVEKVQARIDTLSNQMAALGIDRIDLLKIDTEGNEKEVLAGIAESDWPKIRQLLVEVHIGQVEVERIAADLRARGFQTAIGDHPMSEGGASVYHIYATRAAFTKH